MFMLKVFLWRKGFKYNKTRLILVLRQNVGQNFTLSVSNDRFFFTLVLSCLLLWKKKERTSRGLFRADLGNIKDIQTWELTLTSRVDWMTGCSLVSEEIWKMGVIHYCQGFTSASYFSNMKGSYTNLRIDNLSLKLR